MATHSIISLHRVTKRAPVIPYKEPSAEKPDDIANTMATTLPMVAVSIAYPPSLFWLTREDVHKKQVRNSTRRRLASELLTNNFR